MVLKFEQIKNIRLPVTRGDTGVYASPSNSIATEERDPLMEWKEELELHQLCQF